MTASAGGTGGNTVTRFAYVGLQMVAEAGASGTTPLRRYVYGPGLDSPIVWYEGSDTSNRRFLLADERGSIVSVADSTGAVLAINTYDEFGIPASTNVGRFQFSRGSRPSGGRGRPETQAWLPEAGLFYYKARMYSPTLGRFLQTDPIGYADGLNWYNYVGGDPINSVDPLGTSGCNQVAPNLYVCGNIAIKTSPNGDGTLSFTTSNGQSGVFNPTTGVGSVDIVVTGNRSGGVNLGGSSNLQGSVPGVSGPTSGGGAGAAPAAAVEDPYCRNLRLASEQSIPDLPATMSPGWHGYDSLPSLYSALSRQRDFAAQDNALGYLVGGLGFVRTAPQASALLTITGLAASFQGNIKQDMIDALEARIAYLEAKKAGKC